MIRTHRFTIQLAILATAAVLCNSLPAQSSIRLEESTGTVQRRSAADSINIQIGSNPEPQSNTVIEAPSTTIKSAPVQGTINLVPGEFKQSPQEPALPAETPAPLETPAPVSPEILTPAALPAENSISTETLATSEAMDINYLPSGILGKKLTIQQGTSELPMRPEALTTPSLTMTVPDVAQTTLSNGIRFYHYGSQDLPRIRVRLLIAAGGYRESGENTGLAELTQRTIRSGGANGKSGDDIDRELDQIGSELTFAVENEMVSGELFALSNKADEAMALLAGMITKPDFDEKKLDQQKQLMLEDLRRQNDEPNEISRREFRKILLGRDHPMARTATSATVNNLNRDSVRAFHEAYYRPSTLWIGISGDMTEDTAKALVQKHFGEWNRPEAEPQPEISVDTERDKTPGVYFTPKATAQSQVRIGHLGIERMSPYAPAVNVVNSIYGTGGFSSRLMNEVRTKHGYAYGVGGSIGSDTPIGFFASVAASKSATTIAAAREIISVMKSLTEKMPTEAELETARRDVYFTFVNQFDTPSKILSTKMLYDYRGYPQDYLQTFAEKILAVTVEDYKKAVSDFIHPDQLKIYIIGNETDLDGPLNSLGEVIQWPVEEQ